MYLLCCIYYIILLDIMMLFVVNGLILIIPYGDAVAEYPLGERMFVTHASSVYNDPLIYRPSEP